jgi:DNA-binding transcriptional LysR family regulator
MYLDLVKLRALVELRDRGSMTAAAVAMGYTTGAISQQIAALEVSLGESLVVHVGRRVELTDAGNVLADQAMTLLSDERLAREAVASLSQQRSAKIRIGVFATSATAFLPEILELLRTRHPGVSVRSVEIDVDAATAAVAANTVDLAFGVDYPEAPIPRDVEVTLLSLRTETFRIAAGSTFFVGPGPVPLSSFAQHPWLLSPAHTNYGNAFRMACRRDGFEPQVVHEIIDTAVTLAMVNAGLGIAPVTDSMLRMSAHKVRVITLDQPIERKMVLAYRRQPALQPGLKAVIDTILETVTLMNLEPKSGSSN